MLRQVWTLLLLIVPSLSFAAGLSFGENGAKALSLGGAFAGQADDLTAVVHNPAGLAQQQGRGFLVDLQALNQDVTFQRAQLGDPNPATNTGGVFLLPFGAYSENFTVAERSLTVALGVYGPPSVGRYSFNEPNYSQNERGQFNENPRKFAAQRYALVSSDTIILFPGVSAAYQVHKRFAVGASVQYVYSKLHFAQTITTSDAIGTPSEDPIWDAQVAVDMNGKPSVTGILGVMAAPLDNLRIGASFRPPTKVKASGKMRITLGELASQQAQVIGDNADLELTLPMELRVGTHFRPIPAVGVNVDVIYEGWQSFRDLLLTPTDIQTQLGNQEPKALGQLRIPKRWRHTFGARAGGSYRFGFGLELRAGVMYEQQAAPNEYFNIDFPHPGRVFATGGASYGLGPVELVLGGAFTPQTSLVVDNSQVRQVTSNADVPGVVVGNGTYSSGGWIATFGIRGRFGVPKIE